MCLLFFWEHKDCIHRPEKVWICPELEQGRLCAGTDVERIEAFEPLCDECLEEQQRRGNGGQVGIGGHGGSGGYGSHGGTGGLSGNGGRGGNGGQVGYGGYSGHGGTGGPSGTGGHGGTQSPTSRGSSVAREDPLPRGSRSRRTAGGSGTARRSPYGR